MADDGIANDQSEEALVRRDVINRARQDIADGRLWKARDRLTGALVHRADSELLDLLGEVHFAMADLPAAGSLWFLTERQGPDAQAADLAWRERHGADPLQRLPQGVRPRLRRTSVMGGLAIAIVLGLVALTFVVGLISLVGWVLPGT